MLRYSDRGLSARPTFFSPYNDITIIVEDADKEYFYTEVFRRLFQEDLTITRVLGVGGKNEVLARMATLGDGSLAKPEFYVVDGDFDELISKPYPDSPLLYRLRRYDIESYLVEETAICTVAQEQSPNSSIAEFKGILRLDQWVAEVLEASVTLAACAALLQELDNREIRFPQAIEQYIGSDPIVPDASTIQYCIGWVASEQTSVDPEEFRNLLEDMIQRIGISYPEQIRWISGKHILIPLVIRLLKLKTKGNLRKESLCFRLAKLCEFPGLIELKDRILAVAKPWDNEMGPVRSTQ